MSDIFFRSDIEHIAFVALQQSIAITVIIISGV